VASLELGSPYQQATHPQSPGLIDCVGFSGPTVKQFVLERAGYPAAVAWIFGHALQSCMASGDRPATLLRHLPTHAGLLASGQLASAAPLVSASSLVEAQPAIALDYRYLLRLVSPKSQRLSVACWRRYAGGLGWQRRCGPMPLERFVGRFLDVSSTPLSPVMPLLKRGVACPRGASS